MLVAIRAVVSQAHGQTSTGDPHRWLGASRRIAYCAMTSLRSDLAGTDKTDGISKRCSP
jgi:hypothetical protein